MAIDNNITGGLALAWLVINQLLTMLKPLLVKTNGNGTNKAGEQTKDFWEMKIAGIIAIELDRFFEKRNLTIRDIVRDEIEKHIAKGAL